MREFGVRPKRELGQNFLIDSNMLGVIERAAELEPGDVVLEIGGGLGVLSEHLAPLVAHLHVVELDRGLEAPLRDAIDRFDNVTLHVADAMRLDLRALDPAPTKVVANLPYGIAAGAILRTIEELERRAALGRHGPEGGRRALRCGARQRRLRRAVGARPARLRGAGAARGVALRLRAGAERRLRARRPAPHRPRCARPRCASSCRRRSRTAARRSPARSALAPNAPADVRERARAALAELGHPADVRAERLSPQDFRVLHAKLSA